MAQRQLEALQDAARTRRALGLVRRVAEAGGDWSLAETWNTRGPEVTSHSLVSEGLLLFYEVDRGAGQLLLLEVGRP